MVITPVYNPILSKLNILEIKRYAGLNKCAGFSQDMLKEVSHEALIFAKPKTIWEVYSYNTKNASIDAPAELILQGQSIRKHLSGSVCLAVLTVTIGSMLENKIAYYFSKGEYTKGLLLDAAGTTAVENAADQAAKLIEQAAARRACQTTARFSPGYGDFDVIVQPQILALAKAEKINVSATDSAMLLPRKSITALIGFVPSGTKEACQDNNCLNCNKVNCLSRKEQ